MATARDWADAYLQQALADLAGAQAMEGASPSTLAMLLQMVFEKYAKAALLRAGTLSLKEVRTSHKAASKLLRILRGNKAFARSLGGAKVWEDVLGLIGELEDAHPQLASKGAPQLEYPWEDARGNIQWPARDLHIARMLVKQSSGLRGRVLRFVKTFGERFDAMFP